MRDRRSSPERLPSDIGTWAKRVSEGYDRIAGSWCEERISKTRAEFRELRLLDRLTAPLPQDAHFLDVGCGCGYPIAVHLVQAGFRVTVLDASERMIELARQALPGATFILGDMRTADPGGPFDALIAWDSVFHIPRTEHESLFLRFKSWLRPGGRLLLSLGGSAEAGFTSKMFGETFFYSGHDPEEALRILERAGFCVEHWEVDDPSSRGHIAVLADRR